MTTALTREATPMAKSNREKVAANILESSTDGLKVKGEEDCCSR